jgi:hypothetical protein
MPTPTNAPLPQSRIREAKEFVFALLIVVAAFGAGHLILEKSGELAAIQVQNQANALDSQSSPSYYTNNY